MIATRGGVGIAVASNAPARTKRAGTLVKGLPPLRPWGVGERRKHDSIYDRFAGGRSYRNTSCLLAGKEEKGEKRWR